MKTVQQVAAEIAQELTEHPERWTQGTYARDANGIECAIGEGVCWCILGKLQLSSRESHCLWDSFSSSAGFLNSNELVEWNDAPGRTVAEVIALCEQVAS